ncbi:hypothetical protein [Janthinobacterium sp. RB2P8]|uniref:hypothetical protein n=1 Tax=Janthinobacterium sp. RB2P8 TaxID=3424191 RepID=UPI003F26D914
MPGFLTGIESRTARAGGAGGRFGCTHVTPLCNMQVVQGCMPRCGSGAKASRSAGGGWFNVNNLVTPGEFALAFDRTSMSIVAAVNKLGAALESTLLAGLAQSGAS